MYCVCVFIKDVWRIARGRVLWGQFCRRSESVVTIEWASGDQTSSVGAESSRAQLTALVTHYAALSPDSSQSQTQNMQHLDITPL